MINYQMPEDTRKFLGIGAGNGLSYTPIARDPQFKAGTDELSPIGEADRAARYRAASEMLFNYNVDKLDDIGLSALYQSVTKAMFGIEDRDGSVAFGKRASKKPRENIDMLRRFVKGEYNLIEDPEYTEWKALDEEAKFRYALENESFSNKTKSTFKGERGFGIFELAGAGMPGAQFGNAFQNAAAPNRSDVIRRTDYESLTGEEKQKYRDDVISDYEKKLSRRQTLATYLQFASNLSDKAAYLLAESFQKGTPDINVEMLDPDERDRVYSAFSLMRGDQKRGRIFGKNTDFTDDTWVNRFQLGLYGLQQSVVGLVTDAADMGRDFGMWAYAKVTMDDAERKAFFDGWDANVRAERAMEQPLPEADGWLGEGFQGFMENLHWFFPYWAAGKGAKIAASATKTVNKAKLTTETLKGMRKASEIQAAAAKTRWLSDIQNAVKVGKGAKKLNEFQSAIAFKSQVAAIEKYTKALQNVAKVEKSAKMARIGGRSLWTVGEASALSAFSSEYIAAADAAGISREESVITAFAIGLINAQVERLYVPGLESSLTPAQVKALTFKALYNAVKSDGAAGFRKWFANRVQRGVVEGAKVTVTEGMIEEPLQQLATEHGIAFDKICQELRAEGKADVADQFVAFWQSFAKQLPKDYGIFIDTVCDSMPTSLAFGVTTVGNAMRKQHLHNAWTRHQNRRAGSTHTMFGATSPEELRTAIDYDAGLVDLIQQGINTQLAVEKHWMGDKSDEAKNPHRFAEALTAARRAYRNPQTRDVVQEVAEAAGVDVKTAEVITQYLQTEAEAIAFSPQARAFSSLRMSLADIDETTIKTVLPGYVEGSYAADEENGIYSGRVKLGDGTERTIAYRVGDVSEMLREQVEENSKIDSSFGVSFDARQEEFGTGITWASLSDAQRYQYALTLANGISTGSGVFELTDAKGEKVRVNADDVIYLANGRLGDIGYGEAATMGTVRHETWHSLWRFARATLDEEDVQSLAKALGVDVTANGWENKLDEKMAHQLEMYASGHYVSHAVSSRFDKMLNGWAGNVIKFFGSFGPADEVRDPKTGKSFTLKDFYDKVLNGELGSGKLGVEIRNIPATPAVQPGATDVKAGTIPVEVTDADRAEEEERAREENTRFSISPADDAAYLDAVKRGDMETAQKMVREAAEHAGYEIFAFHGTKGEFTVFDKKRIGTANDEGWLGRGFYFWDKGNRRYAEQYANGGRIMEVMLSMQEPYLIEQSEMDRLIDAADKHDVKTLEDFSEQLKNDGYDSVIDSDGQLLVFEPNQIKSADSVTYDDAGNVIPLSQRFNPQTNDIRYSVAAQRQYDDVVARWTNPDGSKKPGWMKAPNGKPTNLTERQWIQVRTPAFKKWFGDWEKGLAKILEIVGIEPVVVNSINSDIDIETIYKNIGEVKNKDGRRVRFVNSAFGKIIRHKGYDTQKIIPFLKTIFENSVYLGFQNDKGNRLRSDGTIHKEHRNFVGFHNYLGKFIDGINNYYVRFTVQELKTRKATFNPNELHSTYISDITVYENTDQHALNTGNSPGKVGAVGYDNIIADYFAEFNKAAENTSKVVDENGEPRVVYHATDNAFTIFDRARLGENTARNTPEEPALDMAKIGFWFNENDLRKQIITDNAMAVFLNIKDPHYTTFDKLWDGERSNKDNDGYIVDDSEFKSKSFIALTSTQIKSATDNTGAFDSTNPDIRYSIGGVYTGSAADYEKPSLHYVGTGEGAQVYGWGLYGSNRRGVAEAYARQDVSKKKRISYNLTIDGEKVDFDEKFKWSKSKRIALMAVRGAGSIEGALSELKYNHKQYTYGDGVAAEYAIKWLEENKDKIGGITREHLYEQTFFTNRPEGDESHLLKWYEPVSDEQKKWIEKALSSRRDEVWEKRGQAENMIEHLKMNALYENLTSAANIIAGNATGEKVYEALAEALSPQGASEFLARADIDGVKYPVDSYGGKTVKDGDEAGWNYVSFRDDNIRVDHKWTDGKQRFSIAPGADLESQKKYRITYVDDAVIRGASPDAPELINQQAINNISYFLPENNGPSAELLEAMGRKAAEEKKNADRTPREMLSMTRSIAEIDAQDGTNLQGIGELVAEVKERGVKPRGRQGHFNLSKAPEFLKNILSGEYFTVKAGVILDHFGKDPDHSLTIEDWAKISEALHDPLVIAKYSFINKAGKRYYPPKSYRIWVEAVINGHWAVVGVEVKSPSRNIDVNAVDTVYGDERISLNPEDIVYSRNNKEGIRTLLGGPNSHEYSESPSTPQIISNSLPENNGPSAELLEAMGEARNVQRRLDMSPEERAATPPWETEDVPGNRQIVRFSMSVNPKLGEDIREAVNIDRNTKTVVSGHKEVVFASHAPEVLIASGIPDGRIYTHAFILRKMKDDHDLDEVAIENLVSSAQSPAAILHDVDKKKGTEAFIILTEQTAKDLNGRVAPVMIYLRPDSNGNYIASAYARTEKGEKHYIGLLNSGSLLAINKSKVAGLNLTGEAKSSFESVKTDDNVVDLERFTPQIISNSLPENNGPSAELLEAMGRKAAEEKKNAGKNSDEKRMYSIAPDMTGGIFPEISRMSDDELVTAAIGVRMALGETGKFSDRAAKVNTVNKLIRRLHPDYKKSDIVRESQRVISDARKFAKKIREDLDRGVSESLILEHLPETAREQFGREMIEEARKGQRLGRFGQKVSDKLEDRQARIVEDAVRIQTGMDVSLMENLYGINLSETIMHLAENPLSEKPPQSHSAGEGETAEAVEESAGEEAEPIDVSAAVRAAVDEIVRVAKTATDANERNRADRRAAAGRDAERDAELAGEESGAEGGAGEDFGGKDIVAIATKKAKVDLENPRHLAEFVAELTRRYWIKEHELDQNAEVWRDLVAVQFLRKTAQGIYAKLCKDLTYSRSRETAMQHIAKFDHAATVQGLLTEMAFVGALINSQRIRDTKKALCEKLDFFLRQKFGAHGRFKPDKEDGKRHVSAEAELCARDMLHVMWLTPDAAADEARELQEKLDLLAVEFSDAGRDLDQSREFVETIRKLNILREFGALRYKSVGEIEAAAKRWEDIERGESDDILREMSDRNIRTKKAAERLAKAFADPKRVTAREGASTADRINKALTGHFGFISIIKDCMRHATDADREAVKDIVGWLELEIQKAGDGTATEKRHHNDAFHAAVESIYAKSFKKVMKEMMVRDDRFLKFMGEVGGKRDIPTKGRAMQLLVSLLQEGRKIEVEDEENPGKTKFIYEGGYHDNIVKHKREGQAAELMKLMSPADMNMIKWLGMWYEQNRQDLSRVCHSLFGIGVYAELPNYFPVKMRLDKQGLEKGAAVGWTIFPKALTPRVKNERDFDTSADIFQMWSSRMEEGAQWKHHAQLGLEMRGIFGRAELQGAVISNHGEATNALMQGFITDVLAGKGAVDRSTGDVQYISDKIRGWTALCALGGNVGVMLKQLTSIPAFGFEIGLIKTASHVITAFTPEGISAMVKIWKSEQRKTRWDVGYSEAVANALREDRPSKPINDIGGILQRAANGSKEAIGLLKRMLQASMITNKLGDVVPALIVGQGIYRDCIAQGMSETDAMAKTWMIVERTQQSSRMENLASIQRRNAIGRMLYQFLSTQRQYLDYELRAIRDVIANPSSGERWKKLGTTTILNHFILTTLYWGVGQLYKAMLGQEPPEDQLTDAVISCLMGPNGSLFVVGFCCNETLQRAMKDNYYGSGTTMLPMESWIKTQIGDGIGLTHAIFDREGDTWDNILDATSKWLSDFNSTFRDLRKIYRFRIKGEEQKR